MWEADNLLFGLLGVAKPGTMSWRPRRGTLCLEPNGCKCGICRFRQDKRWQLAFLWPFLAIFSKKFREEFRRALRPFDHISKAKSGPAVSS